MGDFVDTPMDALLSQCGYKPGTVPEGGPGVYNGVDIGPFGAYKRTPSPNGVREKIIDGSVPKPSGEDDQFK